MYVIRDYNMYQAQITCFYKKIKHYSNEKYFPFWPKI